MCFLQSGQFVTNCRRAKAHCIFAHKCFGSDWCCAVNILFNERTQYLLLALAQWYHLLIHLQNTKLHLMILRLSMMIASSLHLRLQIQNSTVEVRLSRAFNIPICLSKTALCVTFSLFL